ncbi:MAG TPA: molybdenum cofactor guanylyltransferase [Nocardioidaceae bacterium]
MSASSTFPQPLRLGAVVLVGGTGARLGGADKASLELGGVTLLERALAASMAASEVVVVGEPVSTTRPVTWTREEPPGGGPAAGLLAGLDALREPPEAVCVLAVDMPRVTAATVARLGCALEGDRTADAAVLVDGSGRRQPLAGVYRYRSLVEARPEDRAAESGLSIRRLVAGLRLVDVPAVGEETRDVDTWEDLRALGG